MTQDIGVTLGSEIIYVVGTVNGVSVTWTLTGPWTWSTTVDRSHDRRYEISITAYDEMGNTASHTLTINYGMPDLITDRAQSDVTQGTAKGYYNASDLNRVNEAFVYLRDKMNGQYGFNLSLTIKTDWTRNDLGQLGAQTVMEEYRQNVVKIRAAITQRETTPQAPSSMRFLTYREANDIEKILRDVEWLLGNIAAVWIYSGEIYGGET